MNLESPENYNIKTRIGPLLFDIILDDTFRSVNASKLSNRHTHSTYEVHFIVKGSGSMVLDSEKLHLQPNYCYVIPPGVYHAITPDRKVSLHKYTIRFNYIELKEHDLYFPANEVETLKNTLSGMHSFSALDQEENLLLLVKINDELEKHSLGYYTKLQCYFNQILINLVRVALPSLPTPYRIPRRIGHDKRSMIIESFFDQYLSEITLEDLAKQLHLSPRQTNRILQKMYNNTFRQLLTDIRIEESKARLYDTKDSIMLITEKLGFTSYPFFCTMFKQKTGMTPQAYRKLLIKKQERTIMTKDPAKTN